MQDLIENLEHLKKIRSVIVQTTITPASQVANFFTTLKKHNLDAFRMLLKFANFNLYGGLTNDLNNLEFNLLSTQGLTKIKKAINIYIATFNKFKRFNFTKYNIDNFQILEHKSSVEFINAHPFFVSVNFSSGDFYSWSSQEYKNYYDEYNYLTTNQQIVYDQVIFNNLISSLDDKFKAFIFNNLDIVLGDYKCDLEDFDYKENKLLFLKFMQNMEAIADFLKQFKYNHADQATFFNNAEYDLLINNPKIHSFKLIKMEYLKNDNLDLEFKY